MRNSIYWIFLGVFNWSYVVEIICVVSNLKYIVLFKIYMLCTCVCVMFIVSFRLVNNVDLI